MSAPGVEPHAPPLGRYEPDDDGSAQESTLHEVRLLNVPLRILAAGREHHDEVMREFAMLALDENLSTSHVPKRMLELIDVLGRRYAAAASRPDEEVDAALARGDATIDLVYHVPAHVAEAAETLHELMTEADEFCRQQQLLALQRTAVQAEFGQWYLDEFKRQIKGEAPRPWDGPLDL